MPAQQIKCKLHTVRTERHLFVRSGCQMDPGQRRPRFENIAPVTKAVPHSRTDCIQFFTGIKLDTETDKVLRTSVVHIQVTGRLVDCAGIGHRNRIVHSRLKRFFRTDQQQMCFSLERQVCFSPRNLINCESGVQAEAIAFNRSVGRVAENECRARRDTIPVVFQHDPFIRNRNCG